MCVASNMPSAVSTMRLRPIKARLGAVRLALESLDRGSAEHASTSMSQSLACMKDANDLDEKISLEQQAELLALNSEIVWASRADAARVTKALQNIKMPDSKRKQRRRGQNYTAFVDYWTSAHWDRFESGDLGYSEIRAICLSHLIMLECILPNELTIKLINSFASCFAFLTGALLISQRSSRKATWTRSGKTSTRFSVRIRAGIFLRTCLRGLKTSSGNAQTLTAKLSQQRAL